VPSLLAGVRRERPAFLDAQRLQHGHEEPVVLLNRVVVDDRGESRPELHAARGVVSISLPEIDTNLFGLGVSRSLRA
jgi:hypothetical protein